MYNCKMEHSEEFLRKLCDGKVIGDFYPFETGNQREIVEYIKKITGRLQNNHRINVEPDFSSYGSGYSSYINVKISKKDKSDRVLTNRGGVKIEWICGIELYICKLAPYWYFGGNEWTGSYENGKRIGGSAGFVSPESIDEIDYEIWKDDINRINQTLSEFRYQLLTKEEVEKSLWFAIEIPTILSDKPYRIFDCFFYWED